MSDLIVTARDGGVMTVTLNQPEKRNPISDNDVIDALLGLLREADADIDVRAIILTGAGSAFCAGGDLKQMLSGAGLRADRPVQTRRNYRAGIQRLPAFFHAMEVPVIAAVNGPAIGAGCDLACMCDIRIASEAARFASSFVRLGIVPGDGGAWLLPRVVGFAKATELALTGEMIDADEAKRIGLVSDVVPADALMPRAMAVAQMIAANPPHAVRMTKRLLRQSQEVSLSAALDMSAAMQALAHATHDNDEAMRAFLDKRAPVFRGE